MGKPWIRVKNLWREVLRCMRTQAAPEDPRVSRGLSWDGYGRWVRILTDWTARYGGHYTATVRTYDPGECTVHGPLLAPRHADYRLDRLGDIERVATELSPAERKAEELLLSLLSDEQKSMLDEAGHFCVVGSETGRVYRINPYLPSYNVSCDLLRYCAAPLGVCPHDKAIAQMLAISADEMSFLKMANLHPDRNIMPWQIRAVRDQYEHAAELRSRAGGYSVDSLNGGCERIIFDSVMSTLGIATQAPQGV